MLEIYQKMALKWNVENYESPTSLAQQGIFFILSVVSSSINKLLVYGLAVCQPGSAGYGKGQIAYLVMYACLCVHADLHLKKAILKSGPNLLLSCAVVCYFYRISDQTGKDWMSGFM